MATWAFLFKNGHCCFDKNRVETRCQDRRLIVGGVRDDDEAAVVAKKLVEEEGCWLALISPLSEAEKKQLADVIKEMGL